MKRISFNGGELSPALTLRSDLDAYQRGCASLVNFAVGATGGIRRRRGFRKVMAALEQDEVSVVVPFVYSQDLTYVVELTRTGLRVVHAEQGDVVAEFEGKHEFASAREVTWQQLNALLFIASPNWPLMVLKVGSGLNWTYEEYKFAQWPWETVGLQEQRVSVSAGDFAGKYEVALPEGVHVEPGDRLRVSYYTERQEASATAEELLAGVGGESEGQRWYVLGCDEDEVTAQSQYEANGLIAVAQAPRKTYWVCVRADGSWEGSRDFVEGMTSPENYGEDFAEVPDSSEFGDVEPIWGLDRGMTYKRGDKVVLLTGCWEYWTCIRDFMGEDYVQGRSRFGDYAAYFLRGIAVGEAVSCKGPWKFQCSGTWYGAYEVRRSDGMLGELNDKWETLGESVSPIGGAVNEILTGNEKSEGMLRLFLTRSRQRGESPEQGFVPNTCSNALVVPSYKADMVLRKRKDGLYECEVNHRHRVTQLESDDWSLSAFNRQYGYPGLVAFHGGRLVLAATRHQPQTLWFSQTDDLNNFALSDEDTGALLLTMQTETQSPICWLSSHGDALMVGTMDAEWTVSGVEGGLTAESAVCRNYGYRGSAAVPAVRAENKVLYCERGAGRVMEYGYRDDVQGYVSADTTVFADHIGREHGGFVQGTLLRKPDYVAVYVLGDGTLALMTYNTMHNVNAWHRYETEGVIESVCALPGGEREDKLFALVRRDTDAGRVRQMEVLDGDSPYEDDGGRDYVSKVVTTAFSSAEVNDRKRGVGAFRAYFATGTSAECVWVSTGGGWRPIAHSGALEVGWVQLVAASTWEDMPYVGIRVCGPAECEILAVQV